MPVLGAETLQQDRPALNDFRLGHGGSVAREDSPCKKKEGRAGTQGPHGSLQHTVSVHYSQPVKRHTGARKHIDPQRRHCVPTGTTHVLCKFTTICVYAHYIHNMHQHRYPATVACTQPVNQAAVFSMCTHRL